MKIKDSTVHIAGIRPELVFALFVAEQIYQKYDKELVITSLVDGRHSPTSLHYAGCAADLRTNFFTRHGAEIIRDEIRDKLGTDFDVILESNHIHLEFQPKLR